MKTTENYKNVEAAIVTITGKGGRGVLVRDGLILTAAHCVEFDVDGGSAHHAVDRIVNIKTAEGKPLKVRPMAVEPITDLAVLGPLDDQTFSDEVEAFERFTESTMPVVVSKSFFKPFEKFPVLIYNRNRKWVKGDACLGEGNVPTLRVEASQHIRGGASGGPIIMESGELVGIVSVFSEQSMNGHFPGPSPRPHLALPVWLAKRITG